MSKDRGACLLFQNQAKAQGLGIDLALDPTLLVAIDVIGFWHDKGRIPRLTYQANLKCSMSMGEGCRILSLQEGRQSYDGLSILETLYGKSVIKSEPRIFTVKCTCPKATA